MRYYNEHTEPRKVWTIGIVLKNPQVYNKGTKYEKTEDTFLFTYTNAKTEEEARHLAEEYYRTQSNAIQYTGFTWDDVKEMTVKLETVYAN